MHLITLLTDFGLNNAYVAQMKGVIYSLAPMAKCIDIAHTIPPQNIRVGSFLLSSSVDYFPKGTIHVGVVDPGVGTNRRGIIIATSKHVFIGPDNGLLIKAAQKQGAFDVFEITNDTYFNETISQTFHGRDIFAPVAAHILRGVPFDRIGIKTTEYVTLPTMKPRIEGKRVEADVAFIDDFGNIITNLDAITFHSFIRYSSTCTVTIRNNTRQIPYTSAYGNIAKGELLLTTGSTGYVEIAANQANASHLLDVSVDDTIVFDFTSQSEKIDIKQTE